MFLQVLPTASKDQQVLVNLVSAIRVMPIDTLVQTVHLVVKQPPAIQGASPVTLNHFFLELFVFCSLVIYFIFNLFFFFF